MKVEILVRIVVVVVATAAVVAAATAAAGLIDDVHRTSLQLLIISIGLSL
jgi:hypothetical protein